LALAGVLLTSGLARADQIVTVWDEHGHKLYINTGETSTRADWMSRSFRPLRSSGTVPVPADIDRLVKQTADHLRIDPQLVHAIIQVESEYDPNAVSRKGAMGLMQLIPATAQRFGVDNPFDPRQNIEGGVNYLKYLLDLFGGDLALSLAAYNAGEHSVQRIGGIPALTETQQYVHKVTKLYQSGSPLGTSSPREPQKAPIHRYVDEQGVVHFTNVD
jgi:soluble lytic murein transglycosylase-like protein